MPLTEVLAEDDDEDGQEDEYDEHSEVRVSDLLVVVEVEAEFEMRSR